MGLPGEAPLVCPTRPQAVLSFSFLCRVRENVIFDFLNLASITIHYGLHPVLSFCPKFIQLCSSSWLYKTLLHMVVKVLQ